MDNPLESHDNDNGVGKYNTKDVHNPMESSASSNSEGGECDVRRQALGQC